MAPPIQSSQFGRTTWGPQLTPRPGSTRPVPTGREAARELFSELASKFPYCDSVSASFTSIPVPDLTVPAGQSAWLSLVNFDPWAELNQDIVVFGIWTDMLSCNPSPTTPASEAAWGDDKGLGAAIIVGDQQLPIGAPGAFTTAAVPIAGVESAVGLVTNSRGRKFWSRTFPTGKYTTGWNKRGINGAVVPFVRRITKGNSLRAAFVLNRTQANAAPLLTINGYMDLEIYFGFSKNPVDLVSE